LCGGLHPTLRNALERFTTSWMRRSHGSSRPLASLSFSIELRGQPDNLAWQRKTR
jgi:hypothetical protein